MNYDAILLMSFGGPEKPEDVMPFLRNVTRGRGVPDERLEEVAKHYYQFGGKSPINDQNKALIEALQDELNQKGPELPVYFGNRNWDPLITDTVSEMKANGVKKALAFFTSPLSCYSGCRQYRENILSACEQVGEGAPQIDRIRMFFNHPAYIEVMAERTKDALATLPTEFQADAKLVFCAHSIPNGMAENSFYEKQFIESSKLVAEKLNWSNWQISYQSRSGAPHMPWLEPDILDFINELDKEETKSVVLIPIGFISDHMEVLFDLDTEAKEECEKLGIAMARAGTAGTHPRFVSMIRDLIIERIEQPEERAALGEIGAWHDVCPKDCCLPGARPTSRPTKD